MPKYINADKYKKKLWKKQKAEPMICDDCFHNTVCRLDGNEMLEWCSARVPSADVVEVRHGKWNTIQAGMFVCSFCGAKPDEIYKNFCPNCGADMKKQGEQNG